MKKIHYLLFVFLLAIAVNGYSQEPIQTPNPAEPPRIWVLKGNGEVSLLPTPVPLPDEFIVDLPGLPEDATPLVLVRIPAGSFMMGRYPGEQDSFSYEDPQHLVTISQDFYLGKFEVTKAQWQAVMGTMPWTGEENISSDPNSPAVWISWKDCMSFVNALNQLGVGTFRLPTEAEWEYACRAGTQTRFYWGDDPDYFQISDYAWWAGNTLDINEFYAHAVGQKLPNNFGLYDMSGNVWEWCLDWFGSYPTGMVTDPVGLSGDNRVRRGGRWSYEGEDCRSANRSNDAPENYNNGTGFRIARIQ